jgi:hypothetical protein
MKKEIEDKKPRLKINVCTVPNGYSLTVGTNHYLYFTVEQLLAGFIYHVGLGENNFVSNEFISAIVEAAADWKSGGDFVKKEAEKVISMESRVYEMKRQCKLLVVENKNLKKMLQKKGVNVIDD